MLISHLILFETNYVAKFHWLPPGLPTAWLWHVMLLLACLQMKARFSKEEVISSAEQCSQVEVISSAEQCSQLQNCAPPVNSRGIAAAHLSWARQNLRRRYWLLQLLLSLIREQAGLLLSADLPCFESLHLQSASDAVTQPADCINRQSRCLTDCLWLPR